MFKSSSYPTETRLRCARALIEGSKVGDQLGTREWGRIALVELADVSQTNKFIAFLSDLGFSKAKKASGVGHVWTFEPAAYAKAQAICDAAGLSAAVAKSVAPTHAPHVNTASRSRSGAWKAAQRGLAACVDLFKKHKLPTQFMLSDVNKKYGLNAASFKNHLNAMDAFGALVRESVVGGRQVRLTPLGIDLVTGSKIVSDAAFKRARDQYAPYKTIELKLKASGTREECSAALTAEFKWSAATVSDTLTSFVKDRAAAGTPAIFGGSGKAQAVPRRVARPKEDAKTETASIGAAQDELDVALAIFGNPQAHWIRSSVQHAYATMFSPAAARRGKSTEEQTLKGLGEGVAREMARLGASVDEKSVARDALKLLQNHGWMRDEMDYSCGAKAWAPTFVGKHLMKALHLGGRTGRASGGSNGSFRHCARSLNDFLENPTEAEPLLSALRAANDVCEDLADEADRWRASGNELVDKYDSAADFDEAATLALRRHDRLSIQITAHGADANWASIHELLAKIQTLEADPRIASLCSDIDYYRGGKGPWSSAPSQALSWCIDQIRAALDIARKERSPELVEAMSAFSKQCHALIRSRASREKSRESLALMQQALCADAQRSSEAGELVLGMLFAQAPRPWDRERMDMLWRESREIAKIDDQAKPTAWDMALGGVNAAKQEATNVNAIDCMRWLDSVADQDAPILLSQAFDSSSKSLTVIAACQMAEVYCAAPASKTYCRPIEARAVFGPIRRVDCVLLSKAAARKMALNKLTSKQLGTEI